MFKGWLCKAPQDLILSGQGEAYCKWCQVTLHAQKHDLKVHCSRRIHQNKATSLTSGKQEKLIDTGLHYSMSDEDSNSSSRSSESWSNTSKKPKSKFDEFFEINHASQIALCKLCQHKKVEIKMKNRNTSGLRKHLISCHKKESLIFLPERPNIGGDIKSFLKTAGKSAQGSNKTSTSDKHRSRELPENNKKNGYNEDQQAQNVRVRVFRQYQHEPVSPPPRSAARHLAPSSEDHQARDEHYYWVMACAADLRNMDRTQQIYAKKAIAEILMEGQLGALSRESVRINNRLDNSILLKIGSPRSVDEADSLQNDQS